MTMGYAPTPFEVRFPRLIEPDLNSGCWIWAGTTSRGGYGQIHVGGKQQAAHRLAYRAFRGDPGDLCVLHRCDVRACVNPEHLFLGTKADNTHDMDAKGRRNARRAETHQFAKLTWDAVRRIRAMAKDGVAMKDIAPMFGVAANTVSQIVRGRRWPEDGAEYRTEPPSSKGEANSNAKLNLAKVADIRARLVRGDRAVELAREYGVRRAAIYKIRDGKAWK